MIFSELIYLINSDLYRYSGKTNLKLFLKHLLTQKAFKVSFWYRISRFFYLNNNKVMLLFSKIIYKQYQEKFCIDLSYKTAIGSGLCLRHVFGIAINDDAIIGNNVEICQNVTIGATPRGNRKGTPVIKDNVLLAPGCVVIGNISVGNNVIIGANTVVIKDAPDNSVLSGIPSEIISEKGSDGYIKNIDYKDKI